MGGRWTVGGTGNGVEVVGWEGWSLQMEVFSLHFPFWESCVSSLAPLCPARESHGLCTRQPSQIPPPAGSSAPCPWMQDLLAAPDHPGGEIPEPVLNQFFLEITSHFLTQIISFCLRGSSLEFLNATAWIDEVTGKCMAVDSCFPGDFSSPSNQGRQRLSP